MTGGPLKAYERLQKPHERASWSCGFCIRAEILLALNKLQKSTISDNAKPSQASGFDVPTSSLFEAKPTVQSTLIPLDPAPKLWMPERVLFTPVALDERWRLSGWACYRADYAAGKLARRL